MNIMHCPYCKSEGLRRELHAHLVEQHGECVRVRSDEKTGRLYYRLNCPLCEEYAEQEVKPRGHDPTFLETYEREIRLVAFDMLLYHVEAAHEE